jgi:hypothetical protein
MSRHLSYWVRAVCGGLISALGLGLFGVCQAATVTTEANVPLNQSPFDALQGLTGVSTGSAQERPLSELTNAATATTPNDDLYLIPDSSITLTFDLGATGATTRELGSVSIWLKAGDPHRVDYAGGVAVSVDGTNFTPVASTPRVDFNSGTPDQSHVLYSFAPAEVVGFRYLQIRDEAVFQDQGVTFGTGPFHPRIIEIDAFVPEPTSAGLGCVLGALVLMVRRR